SPPTIEIDARSLHDALPISPGGPGNVARTAREAPRTARARDLAGAAVHPRAGAPVPLPGTGRADGRALPHGRASHHVPERSVARSEEHTSELQSRENLVCRL